MINTTNRNDWHIRVSLTSNCNFRCVYCNPEGIKEEAALMSNTDIENILKAASTHGISRVHWTGGEPTLRNINHFLSYAKQLGYKDQIITTNGARGGDLVKDMKQSGLTRLIVSLDSLDPVLNKKITGRDNLDETLDTIETGVKLFSKPTKMNIVYMENTLSELPQFLEYAKQVNQDSNNSGKLVLKLIELCPNNPVFYDKSGKDLYSESHRNRDLLLSKLNSLSSISPVTVEGDNPNADYFHAEDYNVDIGLVTMPSLDYRCGKEKCRKLRINPYGAAGVCISNTPILLKDKSYDEIEFGFGNLLDLRSKLDRTNLDRRHFKAEYGFWRFGLCERNK